MEGLPVRLRRTPAYGGCGHRGRLVEENGKGWSGVGCSGEGQSAAGGWLKCSNGMRGPFATAEYTLDADGVRTAATVIEAEKEQAQWTYLKEKGYQPLLGFLFEPGLILCDEFRDGPPTAGACSGGSGRASRTMSADAPSADGAPAGKRIRLRRTTITADQDRAVRER